MRSHYVSQSILRAFARYRHIAICDKQTLSSVYFRKPGDFAYIEKDDQLIGELEREWSREIETNMWSVYKSLRAGAVLHSEKHVATLKRVLALHYIRSHAFEVVFEESRRRYGYDFLGKMAVQLPVETQVRGGEWYGMWMKSTESSRSDLLRENIEKVERFLDQHELEVGQAPKGSEFIIGDNPVLTLGDGGSIGILQHVSLMQSDSFGMPLSPEYFVAVITNPKSKAYTLLTEKEVFNANEKQIRGCVAHFYRRPTPEEAIRLKSSSSNAT